MRTIVGLAAACVGGLLALGVAAALQPPVVIGKGPTYPAEPTWTEIKWPFPADPWGAGKAYVCTAGDCGADVHLYLRAKIGFCDCSRGVEDDEELERVSDIALVASRYQASRADRDRFDERSKSTVCHRRFQELTRCRPRSRLPRPLRPDRRNRRSRRWSGVGIGVRDHALPEWRSDFALVREDGGIVTKTSAAFASTKPRRSRIRMVRPASFRTSDARRAHR
jgi:hypothetical protein